jgi:DNA-binding MarR family transcriptional regulator
VRTGSSLLSYLAAVHRVNPDAEVSGPELQAALGLDAATVKAQIDKLDRRGLVEWDPLLTNLWVRITDKGLAAVEDAESYPGLG